MATFKKKKTPVYYINKDTEARVKEFIETEDQAIYEEHIHPALVKMVDSVLVNYNKSVNIEPHQYDEIREHTLLSLYQALFKFDFAKGKKLFSYLSVCAKQNSLAHWQKLMRERNKNIHQFNDTGWEIIQSEVEQPEAENVPQPYVPLYNKFWHMLSMMTNNRKKKSIYSVLATMPLTSVEQVATSTRNLHTFLRGCEHVWLPFGFTINALKVEIRRDAKKLKNYQPWVELIKQSRQDGLELER